MNIQEYAAHRGCEPSTIQNALLAGRIARRPDGTIDPAEADQQWEKNTRARLPLPGSGRTALYQGTGATEAVPGMGYADARALKEVYEAQKRKLELEVRQGELISRKDVERAAFTRFRNLRDAASNVPARLSALLAAETDEHKVYALLDKEIRRVFEDFADAKL